MIHRYRVVAVFVTLFFAGILFSIEQSHAGVSRAASETWSTLATAYTKAEYIESTKRKIGERTVPQSVKRYYDQAWAPGELAAEDSLGALTTLCSHTEWHDNIYLKCAGFNAGLTSVMSELRTCLRMAAEAGVNLIIPIMALRDSTDLRDFRTFDDSANLPYSDWFDEEHLVRKLQSSCPKMKIARLDENKQPRLEIQRQFSLDMSELVGYQMFTGWAYAGRTWKDAFHGPAGLFARSLAKNTEQFPEPLSPNGVLVADMWTPFLFFRSTEDVTGLDMQVWHELSHLIRFREGARNIVSSLLGSLGDRPFIGIHYRGEKDNIWDSAQVQLDRDLDMAEQAWQTYVADKVNEKTGAPWQKTIYLACGDQEAIDEFTQAANGKGFTVLDKWSIAGAMDKFSALLQDGAEARLTEVDSITARSSASLVEQINALPFDHQGSIDLAITLVSTFFIGFTGSAFGYTVGNFRDPSGKYRGPSLDRYWDEDGKLAATYLYPSESSTAYSCCL